MFYSEPNLSPKMAQNFLTEFVLELPSNVKIENNLFTRFKSPLNGFHSLDSSNHMQFIFEHHKNMQPTSSWNYESMHQNDFVDFDWTFVPESQTNWKYEFEFIFKPDHNIPALVAQTLSKTSQTEQSGIRGYFWALDGFKIDQAPLEQFEVLPSLTVDTFCFDMTRDLINRIYMKRQRKIKIHSGPNAKEYWLVKAISLKKSVSYSEKKKPKPVPMRRRKRKGKKRIFKKNIVSEESTNVSYSKLKTKIKESQEPMANVFTNTEKEDFIKMMILAQYLNIFENNLIFSKLTEAQRNAKELIQIVPEDEMGQDLELWSVGTGNNYRISLNFTLLGLDQNDIPQDLQKQLNTLLSQKLTTRIEKFEAEDSSGFGFGVYLRVGLSGEAHDGNVPPPVPLMSTVPNASPKKKQKLLPVSISVEEETQTKPVVKGSTPEVPLLKKPDNVNEFIDSETIQSLKEQNSSLNINKFHTIKVIMAEIISKLTNEFPERKKFVYLPVKRKNSDPKNLNVKYITKRNLLLELDSALVDFRKVSNASNSDQTSEEMDQLTFSIKVPSKTFYFSFLLKRGVTMGPVKNSFWMKISCNSSHPESPEESLPIKKTWLEGFQKETNYTYLSKQIELQVFRGLQPGEDYPIKFKNLSPRKKLKNPYEILNFFWEINLQTMPVVKNLIEPTMYNGYDISPKSLFNGKDNFTLKFKFNSKIENSDQSYKSVEIMIEREWGPCKESVRKFFTLDSSETCRKFYSNSRIVNEFTVSMKPIIETSTEMQLYRRMWVNFTQPSILDESKHARYSAYKKSMDYNFDLGFSIDIQDALLEKSDLPPIKIQSDLLFQHKRLIDENRPQLSFSLEKISSLLRGIAFEENPSLSKEHGIIQFLKDQTPETPFIQRTQDFLKVSVVAGSADLKNVKNPVLAIGYKYFFKIEMDKKGLQEDEAVSYIKELSQDYEFRCLRYIEHYEKYQVVLDEYTEIDLVSGQLNFGIRARVTLYERRQFLLI
jgi:hypothetical protein